MAKKLVTSVTAMGLCALFVFSACSEGTDEPTNEGDGMGGSGEATGGTTATSTGGTTTAATGGTTASGPSVTVAFDSTLEGFGIDWEEPDTWSAANGMGGAGSQSELAWTGDDGDPAGAAMLTIPFDFTGTGSDVGLQKVHLGYPLDAETDLSDATVSASIKLISGGSETCPVNGKVFVKTGASYIWGDGGTVNLVEGSWVTASMDVSSPGYTDTGFDETAAVQVGIEISPSNGDTCVTGEVVLVIDNLSF